MLRKLATLVMIGLIPILFSQTSFAGEFDDINPVEPSYTRPDSVWDGYTAFGGGLGYVYNENSEIGSLNFEVIRMVGNKKFEYRFPLIPISIVKRESKAYRYSFQAPVTLLSLGIGALVHKLLYNDDEYMILENPDIFTSLLLSPNSSLQLNITEKFQIGLNTQTDYLLYRDGNEGRGILFTPSLTFTIIRQDMLVGRGGFTLALSHSNFLNFDGDNKADGFGVRVHFYGDATSH